MKAVIDNKHVLFPWLVMHAGVSITRHETVHDGKTAYREDQAHETKQHDATVWRKGRLDDAEGKSQKEQAGFDSSIWSVRGYRAKNRRCVVLNLEGVVAARTVHGLSEDRKWDTEFMSNVEGAQWDFKANAADDTNDGGIPERVDARPPDPPIEIPPRINVRRMYIRRVDVEKCGPKG